eukprot:gene20674-biopygen6875
MQTLDHQVSGRTNRNAHLSERHANGRGFPVWLVKLYELIYLMPRGLHRFLHAINGFVDLREEEMLGNTEHA